MELSIEDSNKIAAAQIWVQVTSNKHFFYSLKVTTTLTFEHKNITNSSLSQTERLYQI